MKKIIILFVLIISTVSFGQCQKCTSITEASKEPEKVKSLIINGYMSPDGPSLFFQKKLKTLKIFKFYIYQINNSQKFLILLVILLILLN
jgi:spermidine/putrescine-binding protein